MNDQKFTCSTALPKEALRYFNIRILGKPFIYLDEKGKIRRGVEFEGIKYLE